MKKLQKKAKASRAAASAPRNKSRKVRAEVVPQEALYRIEVWGECAESRRTWQFWFELSARAKDRSETAR
jgi:hypothetical protein